VRGNPENGIHISSFAITTKEKPSMRKKYSTTNYFKNI